MENEKEYFGDDLTKGDVELEDIVIEFSPKPSFAKDAEYIALRETSNDEEQIPEPEIHEEELLIAEIEPTNLEEEIVPYEKPPLQDEAEISHTFFDDKPIEVDEKQKVVESIEGMTETAEEATEEIIEEEATEIARESRVEFEDEGKEIAEEATGEVEQEREGYWRPRTSMRDVGPLLSARASMRISMSMESESSRKPSTATSRRFTINYPEKARIKWEAEVDDLMMGFDEIRAPELKLDEIVEEEEHIEEEHEEQEPVLDRAPYYERHAKALEEITEIKIRSFILQKKLAIYFKRKQIDQTTRESDWSLNQQMKYNWKLETWKEFLVYDERERSNEKRELQISRQKREEKYNELQNLFKHMQTREREIGDGLIHTKSGNVIAVKLVDRLIHRQQNTMKEVSSMRLRCIKLKNILHEKQTILTSLNEVSPGFLLANYEQLKVINQTYADKIEENDEELLRQRNKCANTIQILAHIREKSTALDDDVNDLHQELTDTEDKFAGIRFQLNDYKQRRDACRHRIAKIRNESGLLTKPTLLRDMKEELDNVELLTQKLQTCKQTNVKLVKRIKTIRLKIEQVKEMKKVSSKRLIKKESSIPGASDTKPMLYRGRPSLLMPFIDSRAFDCLKSIKPQLTYDRRLHNIKCSKTK
ncbi:unnamed protein product [Ceutorhynchus assimilis]|uniref:CCDC113/CCDC96 coiled-coil domain-containing protein n=1 Tax=Ceutorhynchus assimilis TaxID=467358 RepID=A0A9N9QL30_9CUCU|nr:unnamed protein product [Ceutorhynchus assimilis]